MAPKHPPPPLEWHPYYRDRTWLLDWLNGDGSLGGHNTLRIPVMAPIRLPTPDALYPVEPMTSLTMTRYKAMGPAPYVGRPFVYVWWVGVDDYGRSIASDSRIAYTDGR
jgi:hypothetical protein